MVITDIPDLKNLLITCDNYPQFINNYQGVLYVSIFEGEIHEVNSTITSTGPWDTTINYFLILLSNEDGGR